MDQRKEKENKSGVEVYRGECEHVLQVYLEVNI